MSFNHKVITMCSKDYFQYGDLFIKTRKSIDAQFTCYHPDLTIQQVDTLIKNDIQPESVDSETFSSKMQFLKFVFIQKELQKFDNVTFVDFDTFFLRDWYKLFKHNFDLGITVRNPAIKKRDVRAYSNGGVIFAKGKKCISLCQAAAHIMQAGKSDDLWEYDSIWATTLEDKSRPIEKQFIRSDLHWWCDQVLLSALVWRYLDKHEYPKIVDFIPFDWLDWRIGLFDCKEYNNMWIDETNVDKVLRDNKTFICHLKQKGRVNEININI